eukprot:tig00000404_g412.t1
MEPHRRGVHLFTGVIVDVDAFTKFPEIIMYTAADGQALEMAAQIIFAANAVPLDDEVEEDEVVVPPEPVGEAVVVDDCDVDSEDGDADATSA